MAEREKLSLQQNLELIKSKVSQSAFDQHRYDSDIHFDSDVQKNKVLSHIEDLAKHITSDERESLAKISEMATKLELEAHIRSNSHLTVSDRLALDKLNTILTTSLPIISLGFSNFKEGTLGTKIEHNIGHLNYVVSLLPTGKATGTVGEYSIDYGTTSFTVSHTGDSDAEFKYLLIQFN